MGAPKNLYKDTFEAIGKEWLLDLNNYNEVPFKRKTSSVIWSLGEIYKHLGMVTQDHIRQVELCFSSKSVGKKKWSGRIVYLNGGAANKGLMAHNKDVFNPVQPTDIKVARDVMYRVLKQMEEWGEKISEVQPKGKVEHPVLGMLTADEWYRLIVMVFEYHAKGKEKIHKLLSR